MSKMKVIAIAGGSGSGKSFLIEALSQRIGSHLVLSLDDYYLDRSNMSPKERNEINYDHPDAIDHELLTTHVALLMQGQAIARPCYDFTTHTRRGKVMVEPKGILLLDGLFALYYPQLRSMVDLKIYIDTAMDVRLARRLERDTQRRGREMGSVLKQYFASVRPMYFQFIEPTKAFADIVIDGEAEVATTCSTLLVELGLKSER